MDIHLIGCDMPHRGDNLDAERREFAIDGQDYEIDLCDKHAAAFTTMTTKWVQHATRKAAYHPPGHHRSRSAQERKRSRDIRAWAIEQGRGVPDRGRLGTGIIADYDKAMSRPDARI